MQGKPLDFDDQTLKQFCGSHQKVAAFETSPDRFGSAKNLQKIAKGAVNSPDKVRCRNPCEDGGKLEHCSA